MLDENLTLAQYQIKTKDTLTVALQGRCLELKFGNMKNKVEGKSTYAELTEFNTHTFLEDGVNLRGTCEAPECAIKSHRQNFQLRLGHFNIGKEITR